ncbi:7-alpha-hydroxysteroid dehydrogenase [Coleophoma cylindrospora]|uniref:7-alpha-hydroxysteroid dehydrogenase n=1 Tax=Coleophoma cylindrospora TaxID=1849047 RepID=A0A3D8RZJ7_9HELO|nr:7-alpha-hydroxysteroid dehydrogenase [Coleophoma cylindrospora]
MASRIYAVIAGAGPGTGAAVARKFAEAYPVVLLARRAESYDKLVKEINESGGSAVGIATDVANADSVKAAFQTIDEKFGKDASCASAVFNASGKLALKPFLELTEAEFENPYNVNCKGGFYFSQAVLPRLLKGTSQSELKHPPTLLFTGATASLKSSAKFSSFAVAKFATRALAQSLAREFGPRGVHVGHVVIDGVIDLPTSKEYLKDAGPDAKIDPASIADTYWYLHTQPRSGFTHELEVRPFVEKW